MDINKKNNFIFILILLSCFSCREKQLNYFEKFVKAEASNKNFGPYALNMSKKEWNDLQASSDTSGTKTELVFQQDSAIVSQYFSFDEQGLYHYQIIFCKIPSQDQLKLQSIAYLDRNFGRGMEEKPEQWIWKHQAGQDQYLWIKLKEIQSGCLQIEWHLH